MKDHYTIKDLSKSPLKECVKQTATTLGVSEKQVVDCLTKKPKITVIMNNAKFEIELTEDDRKAIDDIVKKNNKKGVVTFNYIDDLFYGEFNSELRRGGTQIKFTMGTFSDNAKKTAYTKAGHIAKFLNGKAMRLQQINNSYFPQVSYFNEYRWVQVAPSDDLYGWLLYYNMV